MAKSLSKIALIEPTVIAECLTTEIFWQIRASLPFMATALKEAGFSSRVYCEELVLLETRYEKIAQEFDAFGISVTINTVERTLEIARQLRKLAPTKPIFFGGMVAAHFAEKLLQVGDYCITGRGEIVLPRLLEALNNGEDKPELAGLAYLKNDELVRQPASDEWADFPSDFSVVENYGGFSERRNILHLRKPPQHSIFFSTGCVNRCRFCMSERRYRTREIKNVIADLRQIISLHSTLLAPRIMVVDDCPFGDRKKLKELLREIANVRQEHKFSIQLQFHVKPLIEDEELVQLLVAAGTSMLLIGFETVSNESLASQNKNTTVEDNIKAIEICRRAGIVPYGYFVVGFETDTPEVVRSVFDFIIEQPLVGQVLPVGLMEGVDGARGTDTPMSTLDVYSFGATVFVSHKHPTMSSAQLQRLLNEGYERIFAPSRILAMPTMGEKAAQFSYWMAHRRWRPLLRAHVDKLEAMEG